MSNKPRGRKRARRRVLEPIDPESPLARIAAHTGENPRDVQAALASLMADGYTYDEVWDLMREAINAGHGIVQMAAEHLRG